MSNQEVQNVEKESSMLKKILLIIGKVLLSILIFIFYKFIFGIIKEFALLIFKIIKFILKVAIVAVSIVVLAIETVYYLIYQVLKLTKVTNKDFGFFKPIGKESKNNLYNKCSEYYHHKFKRIFFAVLLSIVFIFAAAIDMIKIILNGIANLFKWIYGIRFLSFITKPLYKYVLKYIFYVINRFIFKPILFTKELVTLPLYKKYYDKNRYDIHDVAHAYIYLAPALVLILIFLVYPLYNTVVISFKINYEYLKPLKKYPIGINYYLDLFKVNQHYIDKYGSLLKAMWGNTTGIYRPIFNTFIIVFISVPISVMISLLIAVALNSIKKLQAFFQTLFFLPYVTNVIAIGMVFSMLFNKDKGLINTILGIQTNWMGHGATDFHILATLMIYTVWSALPFKILVFLSGIQGIDKQYYQAAQVDAAPRRKVFWKITVPLLSPFIIYITITSSIGCIQSICISSCYVPDGSWGCR